MKEMTAAQIEILKDIDEKFIANEGRMQNRIYDSKRDSLSGEIPGFYGAGSSEPAKYHIDDYPQIKRLEDFRKAGGHSERELSKVDICLREYEAIASRRHRNEFMKQVANNFNEFMDFFDPEKTLDRTEFKSVLEANLSKGIEDVAGYKESVVNATPKIIGEPEYTQDISEKDAALDRERSGFLNYLIKDSKMLDEDISLPEQLEDLAEEKPKQLPQEEPVIEQPKQENVRKPVNLNELHPPNQNSQAQPARRWSLWDCTGAKVISAIWSLGAKAMSLFSSGPSETEKIRQRNEALNKLQKPYKEAWDNAQNAKEHAFELCSSIEVKDGGNTVTLSSDKVNEDLKKASKVFVDVERKNTRVGIYNLYMLHKGMSLDKISSDDPAYDAEKKEYIGEFHKIMMDAANAVHDAQDKAQDKVQAKDDAMKNSPAVRKLKETYLEMGLALCDQPLPVKPLSDMNGVTKNYSQLETLNGMAHNYGDMLGKFGPEHGLNQKSVDYTKGIAQYIGSYTSAAISAMKYAQAPGFTDAKKIDNAMLQDARGAQKLMTEIDRDLKGKGSFSQVPLDAGEKLIKRGVEVFFEEGDKMFNKYRELDNPSAELENNLKNYSLSKDLSKAKDAPQMQQPVANTNKSGPQKK